MNNGSSSQRVEDQPTVDPDTGTQVLTVVEEALQPRPDNDGATKSINTNEESTGDLRGTDRDETSGKETMSTES